MRGCNCPAPYESSDPRKAGTCNRCGKLMDPAVLASDDTHARFFDELESTVDPGDLDLFRHFRYEALERERGGRAQFGLAHLSRSNPREGCDEGTDGANYGHFCMLQRQHETGDRDGEHLALIAAWHAFQMYRAFCHLEQHWRGSP